MLCLSHSPDFAPVLTFVGFLRLARERDEAREGRTRTLQRPKASGIQRLWLGGSSKLHSQPNADEFEKPLSPLHEAEQILIERLTVKG